MVDPAHTLLGEIERAVADLPGATLFPASGRGTARALEASLGRRPSPGLLAFVVAHDGGILGADINLLTVAEVSERGVDRVGTSFLRFLHVLGGELGAHAAGETDPLTLARERCRRDPGMADHWLDVAELQERGGREAEIDETLAAALRVAVPPTPALLLTVGMRAVRAGDWGTAERAFQAAPALEPPAARRRGAPRGAA